MRNADCGTKAKFLFCPLLFPIRNPTSEIRNSLNSSTQLLRQTVSGGKDHLSPLWGQLKAGSFGPGFFTGFVLFDDSNWSKICRLKRSYLRLNGFDTNEVSLRRYALRDYKTLDKTKPFFILTNSIFTDTEDGDL